MSISNQSSQVDTPMFTMDDDSVTTYLFFLLYLTGFYLIYYFNRDERSVLSNAESDSSQKPPTAPSRGFLGWKTALEFVSHKGAFLDKTVSPRFAKYGYTHETTLLGTSYLFTAEPAIIKAMFTRNFKDFQMGPSRRKAYAPLFGNGTVFMADGQAWHESRKLMRPFVTQNLDGNLPTIESHVQKLLSNINQAVDGVVEIKTSFRDLTAGTIAHVLLGEEIAQPTTTEHGKRKSQVNFAEACITAFGGASMRSFSPAYLQTSPSWFMNACRRARQFVLPVVEKTLRKSRLENILKEEGCEKSGDSQKPVFAEALAASVNDPVELTGQILAAVVAGSETTTGLLSFAVILLAQHDDVMRKLREVVLGTFGNGHDTEAITAKKLLKCQYLEWVINETLRLFPPIPFSMRQTASATVLPVGGGADASVPMQVHKGQMMCYSQYILHRRQDLWGPDANKFQPERWAEPAPEGAFLPFSAGYRTCLGKQFALVQASYILVRLVQNFKRFEIEDKVSYFARAFSSGPKDSGVIDFSDLSIPKNYNGGLMPKRTRVRFFAGE